MPDPIFTIVFMESNIVQHRTTPRRFGAGRLLALGACLTGLMLSACGAGSTVPSPGVSASTGAPVTLAAATNSVCAPAQSTPQTLALPDTAGVNLSLDLGTFAAGGTGCQNVVIATGAAASPAALAAATRRGLAASGQPLLSVTLGQSLPQNSSLGLTTVLSGATIKTDANVVFPDGKYDALITVVELGTPFTYSLVFTARGGQLTITGGTALPLTLGQGAVLKLYDRGVVPDGFDAIMPSPSPTIDPNASPTPRTTPSAAPTATPSPTASPSPSPTPTAPPGQTVAPGTKIGTYTTILSGYPSDLSYINGTTIHGTITFGLDTPTQCTADDPGKSQNQTCNVAGYAFGALSLSTSYGAGTTTYSIGGLGARSFRVIGCAGRVTYGGGGSDGTFSVPYVTDALVARDSCEVDLFNQPADVVNADPNGGYQYFIYALSGPVSLGATPPYPAAANTR